jgi:hypothetical protein
MNFTNKFVFLKLVTILNNMDGEKHRQRQTLKSQQYEKNMNGDQSPFWKQHKAQLDHMECKGRWTLSTRMGWNICEVLLHAPKMIKQKFQ